MSHVNHRQQAAQRHPRLRCAVVTVSDTRTEDTDRSGALMRVKLPQAGHDVAFYRIVPDEPALIRQVLEDLVGKVEAVLINGGTGISRRDRTFEALSGLLERELPGFGELFRMLSYQEIGAAAMLSRATAGIYRDLVIFAVPGSLNATKLALDKLIIPELKHLVWEVVRQEQA